MSQPLPPPLSTEKSHNNAIMSALISKTGHDTRPPSGSIIPHPPNQTPHRAREHPKDSRHDPLKWRPPNPVIQLRPFLSFFFPSLLLSSSTRRRFLPSATVWTSRGHWCRPFSPPVRAFIFIAHRVQHAHCSSILIERY